MSTLATQFIAALAGAKTSDWFGYNGLQFLFEDDPAAKEAFTFIEGFVHAHGRVPSAKTIREATGLMLPTEPGEAEWIYQQLRERRVRKQVALTGQELQQLLKDKPFEALSLMHTSASQLLAELSAAKVYDFKQASQTLWPWLIAKWSGQIPSVPLPWPYLDEMTGGIQGGELVSIAGRTGKGKTWLMLETALFIWSRTKQPVVFVSMEMLGRKVMERLAALYTHTPMDLMKDGLPSAATFYKGKNPKLILKDKLVALEASDMPPFIVVDGNLTSTVSDVRAQCYRFGPIACLMDGAYMFKPEGKGFKARHEVITENVEAVKREIATELDLAAFASWQLTRDSLKKKGKGGGGDKKGTEDIAGSDSIGNTSSLVLVMEDVDDVKTDNVENIKYRRVTVAKGRDGEEGEFDIEWDFDRMNFRQVNKSEPKEVYL